MAVLLLSNAATWHKDYLIRMFSEKEFSGDIHIGVLIPDEFLCQDDRKDIDLARSYLSPYHYWTCIRHGKVPLPIAPFTECTGFYFKPVHKDSSSPDLLTSR